MELIRDALGFIERALLLGKTKNVQEWPLEGEHKRASKIARRIDSEYRLSREMGLLEGSEREIFVDCFLAREVVLAEAAELSRKQEEMNRLQINGGLPARLVREKRKLEVRPVRPVKDEIETYSFFITGENLFGPPFVAAQIDERLCPREQEFRRVKRQFLDLIISASHSLYPIATGDLSNKEKTEAVNNICHKERPRIVKGRAEIMDFLKHRSFYIDVFPGHRTGHFRNGMMEPVPFLMID